MAEFWIGDRCVDTLRRVLSDPAGEEVPLTELEAAVLDYLFQRMGTLVSRQELLVEVWGYRDSVRSRAVDTTLGRLRQKLEPEPSRPRFLRSRRGVGIELRGVTQAPVPEQWRVRVAYPRGPELVGRDSDLAELWSRVSEPGVTAMFGPDGVGKAALGLALLRRWEDGSSSAVFVDASSCSTAVELHAAVAAAVGSPTADLVAVRRAILGLARPLIVLANIGGLPDDAVKSFVGVGGPARWVLTSVRRLSHGPNLRVPPLRVGAARELLGQLTQRIGYTPSEAALDATIEAAGGLPLALELIAPVLEMLGPRVSQWALSLQGTDTLGRTRNLDAALRASWGFLGTDAQLVWSRCSVLRDRFDVHIAIALSGLDASQTLAALAELRDRGLLAGEGGWMQIIGPARLFGRAQLGDELDSVRRLLWRWFADHHGELTLGTPHTARALRFDLLDALVEVAQPDRMSLLEIVFVGASRGGWAREAQQRFLELEGAWEGDEREALELFESEFLRSLDGVLGSSMPSATPESFDAITRIERLRLGHALGDGVGTPADCERFLEHSAEHTAPIDVWTRLVVASRIAPSDVARTHLEALARLARTHGWSGVSLATRGLLALCIADSGRPDEGLALLDAIQSDEIEDGNLFLLRIRVLLLLHAERYDMGRGAVQRLLRSARRVHLRRAAIGAWATLTMLEWVRGDRGAVAALLDQHGLDEVGEHREVVRLLRSWCGGVPLAALKTHGRFAELVALSLQGEDPRPCAGTELLCRLFAAGLHRGRWGVESVSPP